MIFALAFVLCALVVTGLLIEGGEEKIGPLAGITTYAIGNVAKSLHQALVWILSLMVAGHIAGVIIESVLSRENLVASMISGYKVIPGGTPLPPLRRPRWRAALLSWTIVVAAGTLMLALLGRLPPRGIPTEVVNDVYVRTCGACHAPYHPSLLPVASWQAVLRRLDDHFGVDNSKLPTSDLVEIAGFLPLMLLRLGIRRQECAFAPFPKTSLDALPRPHIGRLCMRRSPRPGLGKNR